MYLQWQQAPFSPARRFRANGVSRTTGDNLE
jgi:hypothetical protein